MSLSSATTSSTKSTVAIATAIIIAGMAIRRRSDISSFFVDHRGIRGILRHVWTGDHLPPSLRCSMDELDDMEDRMRECEIRFEHIESLLQRLWLDSVDDDGVNGPDGHTFHEDPEVRKEIGIFSAELDRLAAGIDSVLSHSDEEVKMRKKRASDNIVAMMNEFDKQLAG